MARLKSLFRTFTAAERDVLGGVLRLVSALHRDIGRIFLLLTICEPLVLHPVLGPTKACWTLVGLKELQLQITSIDGNNWVKLYEEMAEEAGVEPTRHAVSLPHRV